MIVSFQYILLLLYSLIDSASTLHYFYSSPSLQCSVNYAVSDALIMSKWIRVSQLLFSIKYYETKNESVFAKSMLHFI